MPVQQVSDMEIDEVSLVDHPANQHSHIVIAKRAEQEEAVAGTQYFDADKQPVSEDQLEIGDVVQDAEGNLFKWTDEPDELEFDEAPEGELVGAVGKSAFFAEPATPAAPSALAGIRDELSKALTTADSAVIAKAFDAFEAIEKRAIAAEERGARLENIAKREREIRLEREYIGKAAEYNVPIEAEVLGPVLMRAAERLPYEDCAVLHKALSSAGEMLFTEVGFTGLDDPNDPLTVLDRELAAEVAKGAAGEDIEVAKAQASTSYFDQNPEAYSRLRGRR